LCCVDRCCAPGPDATLGGRQTIFANFMDAAPVTFWALTGVNSFTFKSRRNYAYSLQLFFGINVCYDVQHFAEMRRMT
jgi:hypothetical protein